MKTANSVMREIWRNTSKASGGEYPELTISTDFLFQLLLELEFEQYNNGYSDGHHHCSLALNEDLPIDKKFEDMKVMFNGGKLFKN